MAGGRCWTVRRRHKAGVHSADRDVATTGSVGFDFGLSGFLDDPDNVYPGESSTFAVVRTGVTSFQAGTMTISGVGSDSVPPLCRCRSRVRLRSWPQVHWLLPHAVVATSEGRSTREKPAQKLGIAEAPESTLRTTISS
jgi:hypothetical protein